MHRFRRFFTNPGGSRTHRMMLPLDGDDSQYFPDDNEDAILVEMSLLSADKQERDAQAKAQEDRLAEAMASLVKDYKNGVTFSLNQYREICITIKGKATTAVLNLLRTTQDIKRVVCVDMNEAAVGEVIDAVSHNMEITGYGFERCHLTTDHLDNLAFYFNGFKDERHTVNYFTCVDCNIKDRHVNSLRQLVQILQPLKIFDLPAKLNPENMKDLLGEQLNQDTLTQLGVGSNAIQLLDETITKARYLSALKITCNTLLNCQDANALFNFVEKHKIPSLHIDKLSFENYEAYSTFMRRIRANKTLHVFAAPHDVQVVKETDRVFNFETDMFAALLGENTRLESVTVHQKGFKHLNAEMKQSLIKKRSEMRKLLERNHHLNAAREILTDIDPEKVTVYGVVDAMRRVVKVNEYFTRMSLEGVAAYVSLASSEVSDAVRDLSELLRKIKQIVPSSTWEILRTVKRYEERFATRGRLGEAFFAVRVRNELFNHHLDYPRGVVNQLRTDGYGIPTWLDELIPEGKAEKVQSNKC